MSEAGNNDIKDKTIHGIVQLLLTNEKELKKYKDLVQMFEEERRRKLNVRDIGTQTETTEPNEVIDSKSVSIESIYSDENIDRTIANKKDNQKNFDRVKKCPTANHGGTHHEGTHDSRVMVARENNSEDCITGKTIVQNPTDPEETVIIDDSVPQHKIEHDEKSIPVLKQKTSRNSIDRLSFKKGPCNEKTEGGFMRYQWSRNRNSEDNFHTTEDSENVSRCDENNNPANQLDELQGTGDRDPAMQCLKPGLEHDEDIEYSLSSSNDDFELHCNDITFNGEAVSTETLTPSNRNVKRPTLENVNNDKYACCGDSQDQVNVDCEIAPSIAPNDSVSNRHRYERKADSVDTCFRPDKRVSIDFGFQETSSQSYTLEMVGNDSGSMLRETFV